MHALGGAFILYLVVASVFPAEAEAADISTDIPSETNQSSHDFTNGKHPSFLSCALVALDADEYYMFKNKTVWVEHYKESYNETFYIQINDSVLVCKKDVDAPSTDKEHVVNSLQLTLIGLGISMVCLVLHLLAFCLVSEFWNLPGCNLAALCASLFLAYLVYFVNALSDLTHDAGLCMATATSIQFFFLASFLWMFIMSLDLFRSLLRATGSLRVTSTEFKKKRFALYCLCAFGISLLFVSAAVMLETADFVPKHLKPSFMESCWFGNRTPLAILFAGPIILIVCLNFLFFGLGAYIIKTNKMKTDQDAHKSSLRKRYLMYFRLSVIMGITWIVGVLAPLVNAAWIWYLFTLLNSFQGLFIFIAFTCSSKVKKYFRKKILGTRRPSEQTLSPTFQSYCFYASSIEKDLDKIVDKSKEAADVVVHL